MALFVIGEKIGEGAFGAVYRGLNRTSGGLVAIKVVKLAGCRATEVQALEREFHMLEGLAHPNIVRLHGFSISSEKGYIVMELMPGGSLAQRLREFGAFPEPVAAHYLQQILSGLAFLHERGVIHRDIKPMNLLLTADGSVKLADFGAARLAADASANASGSALLGTPAYMSPELLRELTATPASDMWAVGGTLLELVTGQRPWSHLGDTIPVTSLIFYIGSKGEHPQIPESLSPELQQLLNKLFAQRPEERPSAEAASLDPFLLVAAKPTEIPLVVDPSSELITSNPHHPRRPSCSFGTELTIETSSTISTVTSLGDSSEVTSAAEPEEYQKSLSRPVLKTVDLGLFDGEMRRPSRSPVANTESKARTYTHLTSPHSPVYVSPLSVPQRPSPLLK
eukprot:TRINITY_DN13590_c0_g1_i1.p1 TRINITY_DN13590_c0_g1~~TRINITY_DN13590_c0_g1_i1.p1  ORF type:complete len:396 (-),score=41.94 TRINITY_DN13590_c0_g1_i1:100-1287(-)